MREDMIWNLSLVSVSNGRVRLYTTTYTMSMGVFQPPDIVVIVRVMGTITRPAKIHHQASTAFDESTTNVRTTYVGARTQGPATLPPLPPLDLSPRLTNQSKLHA